MPIQGKYIQLEPLSFSHFDSLKQAADVGRIWNYMPQIATAPFFQKWFDERIEKMQKKVEITYVVRDIHEKHLVGCVGIHDLSFEHKRLTLSCWYNPKAWGTSANHEALLLIMREAFEVWKMNRVELGTDPRNLQSLNVIKKLGATEEGYLRSHMIHHNGLVTDTLLFSILSTEWDRVKYRLENRINKLGERRSKKRSVML